MAFSFKNLVLLVLMLATAAIAYAMRPTARLSDERAPIDLVAMVPTEFGTWREQPNVAVQIIDPEQQATLETIYTQVLTRNYINADGYRIMLSIAYGNDQSDNLQLHKPEVCYPAQGFKLDRIERAPMQLQGRTIASTRLETHLGNRYEPVTYWTVVGDHITTSGLNKKLTEMRYGLNGRIPDGMLVRVSSIDRDSAKAHRMQAVFAADLVAALPAEHRARFSGVDAPVLAQTTSPTP